MALPEVPLRKELYSSRQEAGLQKQLASLPETVNKIIVFLQKKDSDESKQKTKSLDSTQKQYDKINDINSSLRVLTDSQELTNRLLKDIFKELKVEADNENKADNKLGNLQSLKGFGGDLLKKLLLGGTAAGAVAGGMSLVSSFFDKETNETETETNTETEIEKVEETAQTITIANQPVSREAPLTQEQITAIETSTRMGNRYPIWVMEKYNSEKPQQISSPVAQVTPQVPAVPVAQVTPQVPAVPVAQTEPQVPAVPVAQIIATPAASVTSQVSPIPATPQAQIAPVESDLPIEAQSAVSDMQRRLRSEGSGVVSGLESLANNAENFFSGVNRPSITSTQVSPIPQEVSPIPTETVAPAVSGITALPIPQEVSPIPAEPNRIPQEAQSASSIMQRNIGREGNEVVSGLGALASSVGNFFNVNQPAAQSGTPVAQQIPVEPTTSSSQIIATPERRGSEQQDTMADLEKLLADPVTPPAPSIPQEVSPIPAEPVSPITAEHVATNDIFSEGQRILQESSAVRARQRDSMRQESYSAQQEEQFAAQAPEVPGPNIFEQGQRTLQGSSDVRARQRDSIRQELYSAQKEDQFIEQTKSVSAPVSILDSFKDGQQTLDESNRIRERQRISAREELYSAQQEEQFAAQAPAVSAGRRSTSDPKNVLKQTDENIKAYKNLLEKLNENSKFSDEINKKIIPLKRQLEQFNRLQQNYNTSRLQNQLNAYETINKNRIDLHNNVNEEFVTTVSMLADYRRIANNGTRITKQEKLAEIEDRNKVDKENLKQFNESLKNLEQQFKAGSSGERNTETQREPGSERGAELINPELQRVQAASTSVYTTPESNYQQLLEKYKAEELAQVQPGAGGGAQAEAVATAEQRAQKESGYKPEVTRVELTPTDRQQRQEEVQRDQSVTSQISSAFERRASRTQVDETSNEFKTLKEQKYTEKLTEEESILGRKLLASEQAELETQAVEEVRKIIQSKSDTIDQVQAPPPIIPQTPQAQSEDILPKLIDRLKVLSRKIENPDEKTITRLENITRMLQEKDYETASAAIERLEKQFTATDTDSRDVLRQRFESISGSRSSAPGQRRSSMEDGSYQVASAAQTTMTDATYIPETAKDDLASSNRPSFMNTITSVQQAPSASPNVSGPGPAPTADKIDSAEGGKPTSEKPENVRVASTANVDKIDKDLLGRFYAAAKEYGKPVTITSGFRDDEKQAELWVRANVFREPGIYMPAKPDRETTINYRGQTFKVPGGRTRSSHGGSSPTATAIDISRADADAMDSMGLFAKYGLNRPFPNDPVHIQKKGGTATPHVEETATPQEVQATQVKSESVTTATGPSGESDAEGGVATPMQGEQTTATGGAGASGPAATMTPGAPSSGAAALTASVGNEVAKRTPAESAPPISPETPSTPNAGAGDTSYSSSTSDPGNVEPADAATRYRELFGLMAA